LPKLAVLLSLSETADNTTSLNRDRLTHAGQIAGWKKCI